jgi:hypothetical protein
MDPQEEPLQTYFVSPIYNCSLQLMLGLRWCPIYQDNEKRHFTSQRYSDNDMLVYKVRDTKILCVVFISLTSRNCQRDRVLADVLLITTSV